MKKLILLAAVAATALTSCEKGANVNGNVKEDAKMNVVISFPQTMGTRAADTNASDKDVAIESVTVFVFDATGKAEAGNGTTFLQKDFNVVSGNKFELKPDRRIQTTAGSKRIYVGMNLPTELKEASSESVLIESASTLGLEGSNSVAMLSEVSTPTLVSQDSDAASTPKTNVVAAEVKRLVAKVAVTAGSKATWELNKENNGSSNSDGNTFSVTPDKYAVGGMATTFYSVQRINGGKLVTPGDNVSTKVATFRNLNPKGSATSDLDAFYVPEHADMSGNYLQGDLTYAVVRAEFTFAKFAKVGNDGIEYEDATFTPESMVYTFRDGDITYFCKTSTIANKVKNELGITATNEVYEVDAAGKLYTFYHVFLNQDDADMLAVKRNQFFDIKVSEVRGLGFSETVPEPEVPVAEAENTYLEVSIDVIAWDHKPIDQILGR
jgi:hypothetical protein